MSTSESLPIIDPWPTVAQRPTMTIEEAIGLTKAAAEDMELQDMPRFAQAVRLGREALISLRAGRLDGREEFDFASPLPGERIEP